MRRAEGVRSEANAPETTEQESGGKQCRQRQQQRRRGGWRTWMALNDSTSEFSLQNCKTILITLQGADVGGMGEQSASLRSAILQSSTSLLGSKLTLWLRFPTT